MIVERSEAIHGAQAMDCFAPLAMTKRNRMDQLSNLTSAQRDDLRVLPE